MAGAIRAAIVRGEMDSRPRAELAVLAVDLESEHAAMAPRVAVLQGFLSTMTALTGAGAAIVLKVGSGPVAWAIAGVLSAAGVALGIGLVRAREWEVQLARVSKAYDELQRVTLAASR